MKSSPKQLLVRKRANCIRVLAGLQANCKQIRITIKSLELDENGADVALNDALNDLQDIEKIAKDLELYLREKFNFKEKTNAE